MSYFAAEVIRMPSLEPHPNADALSIVHLEKPYKTTVVCRTSDWLGVEKCVYIPVDAVVDTTRPEFSFLGDKKRIKGVKLRGIFSMGLLVPAKEEWIVGQDVAKELGVVKYDDTIDNSDKNKNLQVAASPHGEVKYSDIQSLRKYPNKLPVGKQVVISEKIHGGNARYVFQNNQLFCGSHRQWLKEGNNPWWNAAFEIGLPEILINYPDKIFFGEVYGSVQSDMPYGFAKGDNGLRFFDIYDIQQGRYIDYADFTSIMNESGLETAPILYQGEWKGYDKMIKLSEGLSEAHYNTRIINAGKMIAKSPDNFKEGFVVKPIIEEYDDEIGRVIFKYHSEKFLCR